MYVPQSVFLTKGVGKSKEQLTSFEMALRNASMAPFNLVSVSSIYPAGCKLISKERGLKKLASGQIVHAVYSKNSTCEPGRMITASIGLAIPKDVNAYGYLSEHHGFGENAEKLSLIHI